MLYDHIGKLMGLTMLSSLDLEFVDLFNTSTHF